MFVHVHVVSEHLERLYLWQGERDNTEVIIRSGLNEAFSKSELFLSGSKRELRFYDLVGHYCPIRISEKLLFLPKHNPAFKHVGFEFLRSLL